MLDQNLPAVESTSDTLKSTQDKSAALGRRELLAYTAAFGAAFLGRQGLAAAEESKEEPAKTPLAKPAGTTPVPRIAPRKKPAARQYDMKTSINLWAFPYPGRWTLKDCLSIAKDAGFDGVEINFNLEGEFSFESSEAEIREIGKMAADIGIAISGVCSFLFWPYALTQNDEAKRNKGLEIAAKMIRAAQLLGTDNLLVVPGAVYIPWLPEAEPVPNDVCDERAKAAVKKLLPIAEKAGVSLNMENIFANGYLYSPQEMIAFVDGFASDHVRVHFDTGNIMQYQFPEHWVKMLGKRIKNIHLKEWDKRGSQEFDLFTFRTLLDGTTNWPAVIESLDAVGYRGYLTFEYFHAFNHFPEALIYQTANAFDWLLGKKA